MAITVWKCRRVCHRRSSFILGTRRIPTPHWHIHHLLHTGVVLGAMHKAQTFLLDISWKHCEWKCCSSCHCSSYCCHCCVKDGGGKWGAWGVEESSWDWAVDFQSLRRVEADLWCWCCLLLSSPVHAHRCPCRSMIASSIPHCIPPPHTCSTYHSPPWMKDWLTQIVFHPSYGTKERRQVHFIH